jgi:molybdenum cofactor cytidylyltransferase
VTAVVLAAGASRRFGAHKLLVPLGGMPLVARTVGAVAASAADDVVVVLGRDARRVRRALADLRAAFVTNPAFAEGMSTSLRAGVAAVPAQADALVVVLADQPELASDAIDLVIAAFRDSGAPIVRPVYDGVPGHPVLFSRALFPELALVTGDEGARAVLARHAARVLDVPVAAPAPRDVDTVDDYRACLRRWASAGALHAAGR